MTAGGSGTPEIKRRVDTSARLPSAFGLINYRNFVGSRIDRSARLGVLKDQASPDQS